MGASFLSLTCPGQKLIIQTEHRFPDVHSQLHHSCEVSYDPFDIIP